MRLALLSLLAQHGPEVVMDALSTLFEARAGLPILPYLKTQLQCQTLTSKASLTIVVTLFLLTATRSDVPAR